MKKAIERALLVMVLIASLGLVTACSTDDFTDKKEVIKGSWYTKDSEGWKTLEFHGDHWRGTYYYQETGLVFVSGKYKWENDDEFLHISGTTDKGEELNIRMIYRWGTYQQLRLDGTPKDYQKPTMFYHYVE